MINSIQQIHIYFQFKIILQFQNFVFYQRFQTMENYIPKCLFNNDCYSICCSPVCRENAFICKQSDCQCEKHHKNCLKSIRWNTLKQKIIQRYQIESPKHHLYMSKIDQIYKNLDKQIEKCYQQVKQNLADTFYGHYIRSFNEVIQKRKFIEVNGQMIAKIQKQLNEEKTVKLKNTSTIKQKINQLLTRIIDQFQKLSLQKTKYKFLEFQQAKSIIITQDCLSAFQNQNSDQRFVLIQPQLKFDKTQRIQFRVSRLQNWIGLGICYKDKIIKNSYKFESPYIKHWTYMLSSNGFAWIHGQKFKQSEFKFELGSNIIIQFDPLSKQLIFEEPKLEQRYVMRIDLKSIKDIENICFCVNLTSKNDQVRIIQIQ